MGVRARVLHVLRWRKLHSLDLMESSSSGHGVGGSTTNTQHRPWAAGSGLDRPGGDYKVKIRQSQGQAALMASALQVAEGTGEGSRGRGSGGSRHGTITGERCGAAFAHHVRLGKTAPFPGAVVGKKFAQEAEGQGMAGTLACEVAQYGTPYK